MSKLATLTLVLISLTGCAAGTFDNRIACTVGHDKAFFISEYGLVGVAATLADADRDAICK